MIAAANEWEWVLRRLGYIRLRTRKGEGWVWAWLREEGSGFHLFTMAGKTSGEVEFHAVMPFRGDLLLEGVRWAE